MGLKEPESEARWIHPPKKKWIHCYMSVDEKPVIDPLSIEDKHSVDGDRVFVSPPPLESPQGLTVSPNLLSYEDKRTLESPIRSLHGAPNGFIIRNPNSPQYEEDSLSREELKKRAGNTPSREVHNKLEKNRRAHLKDCFETLRKQLPSMEDKKISNQTILKAAFRYIAVLKRKEKESEHEMERLARLKIAHQQHLSSLKKELSARWDHIDFATILPSSLEAAHKESTTTASEGAEFELRDEQPLNLSTSTSSLNRSPPSPRHAPLKRPHPYAQRPNKIPSTNATPSFSLVAKSSAPSPVREILSTSRVGTDVVALNGIRHLPTAQLLTTNVQISTTPGTIFGSPHAIQVITPEGYKLIPAEHATGRGKPLAITLARSGSLDQLREDNKVMLAVNKNGLSTLQLAVPPRTVVQGPSIATSPSRNPNVTQQPASLIPSYLPLNNGITQLVSLVGPIVVSQAQRGGVVVSSGVTKGGAGLPVVVVSPSNR